MRIPVCDDLPDESPIAELVDRAIIAIEQCHEKTQYKVNLTQKDWLVPLDQKQAKVNIVGAYVCHWHAYPRNLLIPPDIFANVDLYAMEFLERLLDVKFVCEYIKAIYDHKGLKCEMSKLQEYNKEFYESAGEYKQTLAFGINSDVEYKLFYLSDVYSFLYMNEI